jgi:hypothetical protein
MSAEVIQLTTVQQRIDALFKQIEPEVLAAAGALGIEGTRDAVFAAVKRELQQIGWDGYDIPLAFLEPRLACLVAIKELLGTNCDDAETARAIINEDLGIIRQRLPEVNR